MKECSKAIPRRLADSRFARRFFVGDGLDVGGKPDPLMLYGEFFPLMRSVRTWDLEDGDAQHLEGVADACVDFVHSSHCLEHLVDPREGLANWVRVVRPGGHLVIVVPDEDMYEQGTFPSTFNRDHKWTFTPWKAHSWSERSINVVDLVRGLGAEIELVKLERLDATFRHDLPRYDQSLTPVGECAIEFVLRRRGIDEINAGGRFPGAASQPPAQARLHYNQYRDDQGTLREANAERPPFRNDGSI